MKAPVFMQVAASTPFNTTDTGMDAPSTQDALDDLSFMQRDYLVVRVRDYFLPTAHQYKVFENLTVDGNLTLDGNMVLFS